MQQRGFFMLYDIYDTSRQSLASTGLLLNSISKAMLDFLGGRPFGAYLGAAERGLRDYGRPEWDIDFLGGGKSLLIKKDNAHPFCHLVSFSFKTFGTRPTVFLVAPMSGHYATLLHDTVRVLLKDFDVCVTEWINPRHVPLNKGQFSLSDYVLFIEDQLERFCLEHKNTTVFAVCQPAPPVLAAVARIEKKQKTGPATMVLMGGPIDARQSPTTPNTLASRHSIEWFKKNLIHKIPARFEGAGRSVYPGFLQYLGFWSMNPEKHNQAHFDYYTNLLFNNKDKVDKYLKFYNEYNAVMDLTAEFYLETVETVFQKFSLARGEWKIHGELIEPSAIKKCRLLTIEGMRDDIAGQGQTSAALSLCTGLSANQKKSYLDEKAGHYGLFSGSRWEQAVYPVLRDFCLQKKKTAPRKTTARKTTKTKK